jgi:ribonuclease inhibitor
VTIDVSGVQTTDELHALRARALEFPDFYGRNWSAFWDAITGLVELPKEIVIVGLGELRARLPEDHECLTSRLREAHETYPTILERLVLEDGG